jgi:hypothetical protein
MSDDNKLIAMLPLQARRLIQKRDLPTIVTAR